jgi:hypothetical protein
MMVINSPLYQRSTQFALVIHFTTTQIVYFAAKFIGGVKIRVALRQIAGNHWLHLGPTMYLP